MRSTLSSEPLAAGRAPTIQIRCNHCAALVPIGGVAPPIAVACPGCGAAYPVQDGVYVWSDAALADDYPESLHAVIAAAEPRHFWFAARNRLILATLRDCLGDLRGRALLDVGCGTGYVLAGLERAGLQTCGLDMNWAALHVARRRTRGVLVRGLAQADTLAPQFEIVTLCDVIEHTNDDVTLLHNASQALRPGGMLLVTVPAQPHLWTVVDAASGHKRRYTRARLVAAMRRAGLRVRLARPFNALLYPAQLAQRWALRDAPLASTADGADIVRRSVMPPPAALNAALGAVTRLEQRMGGGSLPFGTSLIAVGQRA